MRVKILRQASPVSEPYWQEFSYEYQGNQTVAGMLDDLNYKDDLYDINGDPAPRIGWECSCLQGMCGACAMVINNRPALACDLVVDRGVIPENLKKANAYIEEYKGSDAKEYEHMYATGKCLKCGLCLEVCPNYKDGSTFYGAAFANDCYLIASRSSSRVNAIKDAYKKNFAKGCSKSLSCVDVCPMNIPTLASIAKMNRKRKK